MGDSGKIRDIKARKEEKMRRAKRWRRAWFLLVEILLFVVLFACWKGLHIVDKLQINRFAQGELIVNEGVVTREDYTTIALFGGDSRDGLLEEGTHTDAIMIISIHNKTREVKMISVYRDTLMEQMDGQMKKANHAYFIGGPKEAINVLNRNLDLDIHGYITMDFKALAETVDLLGGIEIHVSKAEAKEMNHYIRETARIVEKEATKVKKGLQVLDGVQAVTYARIRKNVGGDYSRTDRQREVVAGIIKKAKNTDLKTVRNIVYTMFENISTSLEAEELLDLALDMEQFHLAESKGFPFDSTAGNVAGAGSVVMPENLASNVTQLQLYLYNDEDCSATDTVQKISERIETITGS